MPERFIWFLTVRGVGSYYLNMLPRGRLYLVKAPPLVLLDDRVELFCPYLGGLCEDLEKTARATSLGALVEKLAGELNLRVLCKTLPQFVPYLLRVLEARFAGPFAEWWRAVKEGWFPAVVERWDAPADPECRLPVACPVSHAVLLNTPTAFAERVRRCLYVPKTYREKFGSDFYITLADRQIGVKFIPNPAELFRKLFEDLPPPDKLARCISTASSTAGARLYPLALFKHWADTGREPFVDFLLNGYPPVELICKEPLKCDKNYIYVLKAVRGADVGSTRLLQVDSVVLDI